MRCVLQRVNEGSVVVEGNVIGEIGKGIVILVGLHDNDDDKVIDYILDKVINLRIFEDDNNKMNLSLVDVSGELLIVPNFTIYGDTRKGRRPAYSAGASPSVASGIFERLCEKAKGLEGINKVAFGQFQADMKVSILNDGPVTLILDSDKIF